jgi:hypothetical protein
MRVNVGLKLSLLVLFVQRLVDNVHFFDDGGGVFGSSCCSLRAAEFAQAYTCGAVPSNSATTEELLKRAEDVMRHSWEYLEDFNAVLDQLQKRQAEFPAEHPPFASRYS